MSDEGSEPRPRGRRRRRSSQQVAALVDAVIAPRYGARFAAGLLDALPAGDRVTVLDVGCGTGLLSFWMLERLSESSKIIAVDADGGLVELARQRGYADIGRRLFFKEESPERLSFGDRVFDAVVAHLVYRDLDDPSAALREMHRVLVPGGRLLLTTPLRGNFVEMFDMLREHANATGDAELHQRLRAVVERDPPAGALELAVRNAGFVDLDLEQRPFRLSFENADALYSDRLLASVAFPEMRQAAGNEALAAARQRLGIYFDQGALSVTVQAARLVARRRAG